MVKEPTIQDVVDVLQTLSTHIDVQFQRLGERLTQHDERFTQIDKQFAELRSEMTKKEFRREFDPLRQDVDFLCGQLPQLVTKDCLEGRLAHA